MYDFEDIRPYRDNEVRQVVDSLIRDPEFLDAIARFKHARLHGFFPALLRKRVRSVLTKQVRHVRNIRDVQIVIEKYLDKLIEDTTTSLTHDGLDQLDPTTPYLFISNHRDITMDPAFVNYMLYHQGFDTLQIAIGDNLLKRPFLSDLMRLNKSFLVRRGVHGRARLKASKQLSAYIHYCIGNGENVWIAQREGRAKDGLDKTEAAVIKMLQLAGREQDKSRDLRQTVNRLNIVPVAISYELDPCDVYKAEELLAIDTTGGFEKDENSDIQSILAGMIGNKGAVHVSFGSPLAIDTKAGEAVITAERVAALIDAQIIANYHLHPTNYFAMEMIQSDRLPLEDVFQLSQQEIETRRQAFSKRLEGYPEHLRPYVLNMYANPLIAKSDTTDTQRFSA